VTIPNSALLGGQLVNYSTKAREEGLIVHTTVTIGFDAPWRKVHELLIRSASNTSGILETPAPFVLQTSLNDFNVSYQINAYTRHANDLSRIYGELHQYIQDAFNEGGIEILSPSYTALRDGNADTIPKPADAGDTARRAFRVRVEP
jgi:small-conductance mechanosensitive channel